jgi:hypothetical protein
MDNQRFETEFQQLTIPAHKASFGTTRFVLRSFLVYAVLVLPSSASVAAQTPPRSIHLELVRPAHSWQFLDAVGMRAGLLGWQDGRFEA